MGNFLRRRNAGALVVGALLALPLAAQERPSSVSVPACTAYLHAVRDAQKALYDSTFECYSATTPKLADGAQCSIATQTVSYGLTVWAHCGDAARQCELSRKQDDAFACLREANQSATTDERIKQMAEGLIATETTVRSIHEEMESLVKKFTDPVAFFKNELKTRLKSEVVALIGFDEGLGVFTEKGKGQMQEIYDYLFGHTVGKERLRSGNPVIGAIQGHLASVLQRAHSHMIAQVQQLSADVAKITIPPPQYRPPPPQPRAAPSPVAPPAAAADCAILATEQGADLSMTDPDAYDALLARCPRQR